MLNSQIISSNIVDSHQFLQYLEIIAGKSLKELYKTSSAPGGADDADGVGCVDAHGIVFPKRMFATVEID